MKPHTLTISGALYARICTLAAKHQRPQNEILELAISLLTVALPHAHQLAPHKFQRRPPRPTPSPKQ